jgi:spermidine synthase
MGQQYLDESLIQPVSNRFLPLVLLLFIGSGCSALIYEIIWFQLLQLVIGSSAVSLGVLLGTYMGGMCLGSIVLPRVVSRRRHPLRVYALLELGIGIIGVAVLFGIPYINQIYTAHAAHGFSGILLRGAVCAMCLLPPTLLMGATLPAISRWIEMTPKGVSWLGFFYGGNIAGAVFGCLLAGFFLLRVYDITTATYVAASINLTVALLGIGVSSLAKYHLLDDQQAQCDVIKVSSSWPVYMTIGLSGLCALGAEVIWTRLLSLMLGATVYTFSIILAVFLVGLGIGSSIGSVISRYTLRPRFALGCCQMLLVAAISWTAYMLSRSLPYWPIDPSLSNNPWYNFQLDLMRCIWAILPAACLWGASFPLALASVAVQGRDPGRLVGGIYAANTVGAIIGAIGFSMIAIPLIGTQNSQRLIIGLSTVSGLLMLIPSLWILWKNMLIGRATKNYPVIFTCLRLLWVFSMTIVFLTISVTLILTVSGVPWGLVAYGRNLPTMMEDSETLYIGEGMNASIAVTELNDGVRCFHVSGKVVASTDPLDMRLQLMLGHIPALFHPKPRSVLVVGCGAAVTAGSFVHHPDVERIVICEIEPLIPQVVKEYFGKENNDVLDDPRVEMVIDDARHFILTTREKFDIITSDPIHPWVKGAASLYTQEYFELCKQKLNPGGIVTQWVPLYESNSDAVKSEIATFFEVFPYGTIWSNDSEGEGYDIIILGQAESTKIDVEKLRERLDSGDYSQVRQSLREIEFNSAISLLATYAGRRRDLTEWLKDAEINRDRNMRLQYLAGMGLNSFQSEKIFDEIVSYRIFPEDLFIASEQDKKALRQAMESGYGEDDILL